MTKDSVEKRVEADKEVFRSIPMGKFKSGRVWKEKSNRFSNMTIQTSNRTSWQFKMDDKAKKLELKKYEEKLREEKKQQKLDLVRRQKINLEKRKESEKKAEITQKVIKINFIFFCLNKKLTLFFSSKFQKVKNSAKLKRIKKNC